MGLDFDAPFLNLEETPKQGEIEEIPKQKHPAKTPCAVVAGYTLWVNFSLVALRHLV